MKTFKTLPCKFATSNFRKERVHTEYVSTGDLIRANLLKKISSPLLHTISDDEPADLVPAASSRVYDPFAQVITEDMQK